MADERVRNAVKITDPTTDANEAGVNASGQLAVAGPVTNAGTFVVQEDGDALIALQLIDDAIFVDDTATHATGTTKGMGIMAVAVPTDTAIAANDIGMPAMSLDRRLHVDADIIASVALDVSAATVTVDGTGTFVVQEDGAALTALQIIDDPVFADDAPFTLTSSSVMVSGAIRDDSLSALTAVEGDAVPLRVGSTGALHVTGGGGGTEFTEDTAASGGEAGGLALGVRRDADTSPVNADNDYQTMIFNDIGALKVEIFDGGDTLTVGAHAVTNAGTFVVQEDGAVLTALQLIDDAIFVDDTATHATGSTKGIGIMAVAVPTDAAVSANDIGMPAMSLDRRLLVDADIAAPASPVLTEGSTTDTAAGAGFDVDGPSSDGTTKTVRGFVASASVPIKAELIQVDNDVDTAHVTLFARAGEGIVYTAPHKDFHEVTFGSTGGFDGFTLRVTNLDNSQAADLYGSLMTEG